MVLDGEVFRGSVAVRRGLLTPRQLRTSAWRPLFRDVFADAALPVDHELRIRGALLAVPDGVVAGKSAAYVHGATLCGANDPVELLVPRAAKRRHPAGLRLRTGVLPPGDVQNRVTSPDRTVFDLARWYPVPESVVTIDAMLASGPMSTADLPGILAARRGQHGLRLAAKAFALAADGAESPQETRLRVAIVRAGLPPPVCQHTIRDHRGRFVARVDLAWPAVRVALEYDGLHHCGPAQMVRDRRRLNALIDAGWTVLHATIDDFDDDLATLLARLAAVLHLGGENVV